MVTPQEDAGMTMPPVRHPELGPYDRPYFLIALTPAQA
jgi:hypothetical protein